MRGARASAPTHFRKWSPHPTWLRQATFSRKGRRTPYAVALRRKAVGVIEGRLFTVVYTLRGAVIRLISARRCNVQEARRYGPLHP
ncbi:BrnT family toxin [Phenylobacterium aquaticum]|uniref:BrnT family toxin n=1 Tax=Phenylobacterium aquaticum TaxID=1763816 RepID=UPI00350E5B63